MSQQDLGHTAWHDIRANKRSRTLSEKLVPGDFFTILQVIGEHAAAGRMPSIDVVWDSIALFGDLPRTFLQYVVRTSGSTAMYNHSNVNASGVNPDLATSHLSSQMKLYDLSYALRSLVITRHTWWFRILSKGGKKKILNLIRDRKGLLYLKERLNTVDGILTSMMLSAPCFPWSYKLTDHIMRSVLTNSLFNRGYESLLKKFKKITRKEFLSGNAPRLRLAQELRIFGDFRRYMFLDQKSKFGLFSGLNFCQTRNSGIATPALIEQSIAEFKTVVLTPDAEPSVDPTTFVVPALQEHCSREYLGRCLYSGHVSAASTACYENSRENGGKCALAAAVIAMDTGKQCKYDLTTGILTKSLCETPGEVIFHKSLERLVNNYKNFYSVKLNCICEPGPKARTTTSSSFYHSNVLQVYSHISLEILRAVPEVRSGISKSRHGWVWSSELNDQWLFEGPRFALSTDLKTATDYFSWKVVRKLLNAFQSVVHLPQWYHETVVNVLTHPRKVMYQGQTFIRQTKRGCLMGDPVTKSVLTLLSLAVSYRCKMSNRLFKSVGVGDDFVAVSAARATLELALSSFRDFGAVISEDDTYISDSVMYFTEECIEIPKSPADTIQQVMKSRDWSRMIYIDIVKGRLLLDAKKNRDDFSYTPTGRITQLGKDMSYLKDGQYGAIFHFASILQDVLLDLRHFRGFVYFPFDISSTGKMIPFFKKGNLKRWFITHRNGRYCDKYDGFIHLSLDNYRTQVSFADSKSEHVRLQTQFFRHFTSESWILSLPSLLPEGLKGKEITLIPKYRLSWTGIMGRLKPYLISQTEILAKLCAYIHMHNMIYGEESEDVSGSIESIPMDPYDVSEGDINTFIKVWKTSPAYFREYRTEAFYLRSDAEPYLAGSYDLTVPLYNDSYFYSAFGYGLKDKHFTLNNEMDRETKILFDWFMKMRDCIATNQTPPEPPAAILSDDELILSLPIKKEDTFRIIVTNDTHLARTFAARRAYYGTDKTVTYRIPARDWLLGRCQPKAFHKCFGFKFDESHMVIDQGSLDHSFATLIGKARGFACTDHTAKPNECDASCKNKKRSLGLDYFCTEPVPLLPCEPWRPAISREVPLRSGDWIKTNLNRRYGLEHFIRVSPSDIMVRRNVGEAYEIPDEFETDTLDRTLFES
jgi:hypothetical protein